MLDEEIIVKDAKNGSERLLIWNVVLMCLLPAVLFGGNSDLATGIFIALGILAPLNVVNYRRIWIDAPPSTIPLYTLTLLPFAAAVLISACGLFNGALISSESGTKGFFKLVTNDPSAIVSAADSAIAALSPDLVALAAAACAFSMFFITESKYILRRIFFFCAAGAAILALFGFFYNAIGMIPKFILPSFGNDAFSTFTDSSQWAAFAIIWIGGAMTIAAYSAQRYRLLTFSYSLKFFSLLIAAILLFSVLDVGTPLERAVGLSLMGAGCALLFADTFPTKRNLARHWTSRYVHSKYKKLKLSLAPAVYLCISAACFFSAAATAAGSWRNPNERLIVNEISADKITLAERVNIYDDSRELISMRPAFGWGSGSFANVFSFRQGADLGPTPFRSPQSDLLQKIVENGYVGLGISLCAPLAFLIFWITRRKLSKAGSMLFLTSGALALVAVFDNPLQSIAVLQSFWIILVGAFKWDTCNNR